MKSLMIAFGMLIATSSYAHTIFGDGSFRRADAMKAAGAKDPAHTGVFGLSRGPGASARTLFVETHDGNVTVLNAPFDKTKPVTKMTEAQAEKAGVITQAKAAQEAATIRGQFGTTGAVKLKNEGIAVGGTGSFEFGQVTPAKKVLANGSVATNITRFVGLSGKGLSATATVSPIPAAK